MALDGTVHEHDDTHVVRFERRTFGQPDSMLRWELTPAGDAGTVLVLTHTLPSPDPVANALAGWHTLLDMIPVAIDGEDPQWSKERWDEVQREYAAAIA
jgi:hypothetical protein